MLRKTLIAMAVAGALGCSAGAFAGSGTDDTAYNDDSSLTTMSSVGMETSRNSLDVAPAPIEIGDGVLASIVNDEFDGYASADDGTAVGASASAGGSGTVGFSSDGHVSTSSAVHTSDASALTDEAYLVPAPLAHNDGKRYWKVEVSPSKAEELNRLRTENVYVMRPIDDAIVDPVVALTSGPDDVVAALNETQDVSDATL